MDGASSKGDRVKVVFVGPKTFPPVLGGIETHVYEVSKRVAARGLSATVIVPRTGRLPKKEKVEGVQVIRVACLKGRYLLKLTAMPGIFRQLRRMKGAVVHAHDATGGYASALAVKRGKLVYTMHGIGFHESDWPTPFRQGIRMMQKTAVRRAANVFCTDQKSLESVRELGRNAELSPSGIEASDYKMSGTVMPEAYEGGSFNILFVGRLTRVKGIAVFLEAIRIMDPKKRSLARFIFVGEGPLADDIKRAAQSTPEIRLVGPIEHSRIKPYFLHADAFVLPSLSEGLPLSLLEAMASGVPCVASKVGGVESGIDPDALKLVTAGDPRMLAQAMVSLIDDRQAAKRLGTKGQEYVGRNFSWDATVDRLLAAYTSLSRA